MLSTRFAKPVLVLLALSAVPTVIHSYLDSAVVDGRTASAISPHLDGHTGVAARRRDSWGEDKFSSHDWIDRRYAGPPEVKLTVVRSFDAKKLFHHPELAVDYGPTYMPAAVSRLPQRSDVPVYVLRGMQSNANRVALYTLHHEDAYIEDPIWFQLKASFRALFSRRRAMTLFFAAQDLPPGGTIESSAAAGLLLAAMDAFEKQTPQD